MLLGIEKDVTFADMKVKLATGDIVVFYTDGITETQNRAGEMFGVGRLGMRWRRTAATTPKRWSLTSSARSSASAEAASTRTI
jgi:sigma-B regulation protein RsbU (phosphoserine phosphatase)